MISANSSVMIYIFVSLLLSNLRRERMTTKQDNICGAQHTIRSMDVIAVLSGFLRPFSPLLCPGRSVLHQVVPLVCSPVYD